MRKYQVVLATYGEHQDQPRRHEFEADGIGYHSDGRTLMLVLYVDEETAEGKEPTERAIFSAPATSVAYVREIFETAAERRAALLQTTLDEISGLTPVAFKDLGVIPDGEYLRREDVLALVYQYV